MPTLQILLTAEELAARWHLSAGHLANLRSERRGCRFLKIGGRVLYRLGDVEAHEDQSAVETASESVSTDGR